MACSMSRSTGLQSNRKIPNAGIKGTGSGFPTDQGRWVSNEDIHLLKYGSDWKNRIAPYDKTKYGFQRRFWVHTPGTKANKNSATSLDLMFAAATNAIEDSGISKDEIDLVITFTTTSPKYTSSTATALTGILGIKCAAFEIKSGCSSAVYALSIAYQLISMGARNVLIVGGETLSKVTSLNSPFLYAAGDGAGALILGKMNESCSGLEAVYLDSDGSYNESMGVPGILPPTIEALQNDEYFLNIDSGIYEFIKELWRDVPRKMIEISEIDQESIDYFIPNQVNRELIGIGGLSAGISEDRIADYIEDYANCGASGLLIALDRLLKENKVKSGDRLLLCAIGGGIAWAGMILRI
jgi:3-oxoacyl-[acyl-carrier-protein] synthase III